jgi:hypothetical protein
MPLQRRLPKVGFNSRMAKYSAELRLHELAIPTAEVIDMDVLNGPIGRLVDQEVPPHRQRRFHAGGSDDDSLHDEQPQEQGSQRAQKRQTQQPHHFL